jgi:hypothetical protein
MNRWINIEIYQKTKMKSTSHHDEKIAKMSFSSVYPHYITKVEKKGRENTGFEPVTMLTIQSAHSSFILIESSV